MLIQRRVLRVILIAAACLLSLMGALVGFAKFTSFAAERDADAFCRGIVVGENVDRAVARYEQRGGRFHYAHEGGLGHTFVFPGFVMDKASCDIQSDPDGRVVAKYSGPQLD